MDWLRSGLIAAIIVVMGLLVIQWTEFKASRQPEPLQEATQPLVLPEAPRVSTDTTDTASDIPSITELQGASSPPDSAQAMISGDDNRLVVVTTDVIEVTIDTLGGDIVKVALLEHRLTQETGAPPFVLLNRTGNQTYIAQSGLIGPDGTDKSESRPRFNAEYSTLKLADGQENLRLDLHLNTEKATITKTFFFEAGEYLIDVEYQVVNRSPSAWRGHLFGQIKRDTYNPVTGNTMGPNPYLGMAVTTDEENYKKIDFDDLDDKPFKLEKSGGWLAMIQHYFVSAWIPDAETRNFYSLRKLGDKDLYVGGFTGPVLEIEPGATGRAGASFYAGPKDQHRLAEISPYLDLTIDYGWLWWVAKPLFYGLELINTLMKNWGWSIVILTVFVKLIFYPLSAASYRSMARMRNLQPEMLRLRELYGDDRQKLSQEMMGLYKKEKVNPLGGCFPMLIQMPVFIALYWVLNESVELRHAPWVLWITDLSVKDPYYVLPILNGISMYVLQTLQPAPPDPMQAKVMKFMPVAFGFFFMFFPAGLVLYWTVNSVLSIAQQWAITRKIEAGN